MRNRTDPRTTAIAKNHGPCSVWCRMSAPLFNRLFLRPGEKPSFFILPMDRYDLLVDETGRLLENPEISVHDTKGLHRFTKTAMSRAFPIIALSLVLHVMYMMTFSHKLKMIDDVKLFLAAVIPLELILAIILTRFFQTFSHGSAGRLPRHRHPSLLRRLALRLVSRLAIKSPKDALLYFVVTAVVAFILGYSAHRIASYPPTLFVQIHVWLTMLWLALFLAFALFWLLANVVFHPCLRCHGLSWEDFVYAPRRAPRNGIGRMPPLHRS